MIEQIASRSDSMDFARISSEIHHALISEAETLGRMLNLLLSAAALMALPVVILLAIFRYPDPNHEFILDLLEENLTEDPGELTHIQLK
jgi:hypothetical protein